MIGSQGLEGRCTDITTGKDEANRQGDNLQFAMD